MHSIVSHVACYMQQWQLFLDATELPGRCFWQAQELLACVTRCCSFMWCLLALQDCCDAVEWGPEAAHPPGLLALIPGCSPHQRRVSFLPLVGGPPLYVQWLHYACYILQMRSILAFIYAIIHAFIHPFIHSFVGSSIHASIH